MIRKLADKPDCHKIFISAHTFTAPRYEGLYDVNKVSTELLYVSDLIININKSYDSNNLYTLSVLKSRHSQKMPINSSTPFFKNLADEYSKYPLYPNKFLRQHLAKYNKCDMSILPMNNFKDIFNI